MCPLDCFLITRTLTWLCSAGSHYHNRAAEDSYSIRAREPGNTKHASFRLCGELLYLMRPSIYHIANGFTLTPSYRHTLFFFFVQQRCEEVACMSYSHIRMQHHVPEADGRGFYGVCVFGMPSCDCIDTRLNIQHTLLNLNLCTISE